MGFVCSGFLGGKVRGVDRAVCGRSALRAMAEEWTPVGTVEELNAEGGKKVVKIDSGKVLIREFAGDILAMSNSCPHLGLPLEGKILKADYTSTGSIVCSAHKTVSEHVRLKNRFHFCCAVSKAQTQDHDFCSPGLQHEDRRSRWRMVPWYAEAPICWQNEGRTTPESLSNEG